MRHATLAVSVALALAVLSGCGPADKGSSQESTTSAPAAGPKKPYLGKPKVGDCHNITATQISKASETQQPVPCSARHTTLTVAIVDVPADAEHGSGEKVSAAVGEACRDGFVKALGGTSKERAKAMYSLAWFFPTKKQKATGERWMRCDVTLNGIDRALPLKHQAPLLQGGLKDDARKCAKAAKEGFGYVPCAADHDLVPKLFSEAGDDVAWDAIKPRAQQHCKEFGGLYDWTAPEQWAMGDRWYYCWIPTEALEGRKVSI